MSRESKPRVTLIGLKQAREGFTFTHTQPTEGCKGCSLIYACMMNLEPGRVYTITRVREKVFPCNIYEEGVRVVEVEEPLINVAVEKRIAFPLGVITFQPQDCRNICCVNHNLCVPQGLYAGDKCMILEVKGGLRCPLDRRLIQAVAKREPPSA
jgi:uncharacterized protein (UPF0179 family)